MAKAEKTSAPQSDIVFREVTKDVWTFSCPFNFKLLPIGGRTTVIRLSNNDLWVMASTPLDEDTKTKLNELGNVKYLVSGDTDHYFYLSAYKKEWPEAKLIGVDGLQVKAPSIVWDGMYGVDPEETTYGYEEEIQTVFFSGFQKKDVVFYHVASKSIVEADLLFNLPCTEQYSKVASSGKIALLSSLLTPASFGHRNFLQHFTRDKAAMKAAAQAVAALDFDRIIVCHGDVIETGGKKAWNDAYKHYY